jgi:hypothetical protein
VNPRELCGTYRSVECSTRGRSAQRGIPGGDSADFAMKGG